MKTLKQKIELIKDVQNTFGSHSIRIDSSYITKTLTIDEVLSDEFENELLLVLDSYEKVAAVRFIKFFEEYSTRNTFKDISENDREKIIDKYIRLANVDDNSISINTKSMALLNGKEDYFISSILKSKSFRVFMNSGDTNRLLDNTMVNSDSATIMSLFEHLTKINFEYTNYPLVILNKNLDQEQKISIIKQTYKQKDLNKYTIFMKEKLVDLNDLDSFIEAIIIRNNRVKEKSNSIIDLLRRLFIGIRGNNGSVDFSKYENSKAFFEKYRVYFTKSVIENLTSDNSYYISRNASKFLSRLFNSATFEEKIKVSMISSDVGDYLFSESKEIPSDVINIPEKEEAYLEYIVKRNSFSVLIDNFGLEKTAEFVNKYSSLIKHISKKFNIDGRSNYYDDDNVNKALEFFKLLSDDVFKHPDFDVSHPQSNGKETYKFFGLEKSERNRYDISRNFVAFNILVRNIYGIFSSTDYSNSLKERLFDTYLSAYEDEDFVNSELLQKLTGVFSEKEIINSIKNKSDESIKNDYEIFQKILFVSVLKFFEKFYPERYETVKDNFQRLENNLRIIVNI
jgi:hypothetical protein